MTNLEALNPILDAIADRVCARMAKTRCLNALEMLRQGAGTLGRRVHVRAVKRRVAEALARGIMPTDLGAAIDGDDYLLTPAAIAEELDRRTQRSFAHDPPRSAEAKANVSAGDEQAAFDAALARARAARDAGEIK